MWWRGGGWSGQWSCGRVISGLFMHSQREGEPEGRALPHLALDPHLPAMGIDDGLANVQAHTQALSASALHRNAWRAVEWLPHPHLLFGRHTRPLISHR